MFWQLINVETIKFIYIFRITKCNWWIQLNSLIEAAAQMTLDLWRSDASGPQSLSRTRDRGIKSRPRRFEILGKTRANCRFK